METEKKTTEKDTLQQKMQDVIDRIEVKIPAYEDKDITITMKASDLLILSNEVERERMDFINDIGALDVKLSSLPQYLPIPIKLKFLRNNVASLIRTGSILKTRIGIINNLFKQAGINNDRDSHQSACRDLYNNGSMDNTLTFLDFYDLDNVDKIGQHLYKYVTSAEEIDKAYVSMYQSIEEAKAVKDTDSAACDRIAKDAAGRFAEAIRGYKISESMLDIEELLTEMDKEAGESVKNN